MVVDCHPCLVLFLFFEFKPCLVIEYSSILYLCIDGHFALPQFYIMPDVAAFFFFPQGTKMLQVFKQLLDN